MKTKNIIRLGKKNDQDDEQNPPRPLKIVLEDKIYRNKVLQNCDKLGEAEDLFKNISISPDYNKDERQKIRALVTEAKEKIGRGFKLCLQSPGTTLESAAKKICKTLFTIKPTKGTRTNTSEDNKEMKKIKLKECYKSKTAFSMWFTNADTLHNKLTELRNRIKHAKSPLSIIAITEVKPKNTRHSLTEPEIKIDGFDLFTKNIEQSTGRGLAFYVKPELKAYAVIPEVTYEEMLGVVVHLSNNLSKLQEPLINNRK